MIIIAGNLLVESGQRSSILDERREVIAAARSTPGCLGFYFTADPIDPNRICIYERWTDAETADTFRGSGPSSEQQKGILGADVAQYEVLETTSLT